MADDIINTLRNLANRWTMLARDYAKASKEAGATEAQVSYNRGYAEGYYKAATELAALIKAQETAPQKPQPRPAAPAQPPPQGGGRRPSSPTPPPQQQRPAAQPQPAQLVQPRPAAPVAPAPEPDVTYAPTSVGEAINILVFAGCQPRDVIINKDNSLRATFSSWGSMMLHEQVSRVTTADPRIIVLDSGKLESHDYFIDFAFKES